MSLNEIAAWAGIGSFFISLYALFKVKENSIAIKKIKDSVVVTGDGSVGQKVKGDGNQVAGGNITK